MAETPTAIGANVTGRKLAPYNPSGADVVNFALDILNLQKEDIFYDLGCGDGRLLIEACRRFEGLNAVGIDYDACLVERARILVDDCHLSHQIKIIHGDILLEDFSGATAIFLYLVPDGLQLLRDVLIEALNRGVRIVTYVFCLQNLSPKKITSCKGATKLYFYDKSSLL